MGKRQLTKVEALSLITPVVDGEVTEEEREAFFDFIAQNEDVRKKYETLKGIKSLVSSRCPCAKAPESLKNRVRQYIQKTRDEDVNDNEVPIYDVPNEGPADKKEPESPPEQVSNPNTPSYKRWLYSAAASLLLIAVVLGLFNFYGNQQTASYNIEKYAYEHFIKHEGKFVQPTISTASIGTAEMQLATDYDMPMTVPPLKNAEFKGIVYAEFVPNFKAPMLEYYVNSEDQYIYIFAFKIEKLKEFGQLVRSQDAVKSCNKPKDFHIQNVNGKHVVSWKWDDVWYAAISNHNGNTLASLIEPLEHNQTNE